MGEQLTKAIKVVVPDFKGVRNFNDIQERFVEGARSIMRAHDLVSGNNRWQITALELYLITETDVWRDVYTHKKPEQLKSGTWYVHDDGGRAPTYSGIDITCGSETTGIYGGLLIRELDNERRWVFQRIIRGNRPSFPRIGNTWSPEEMSYIKTKIHRADIDSNSSVLRLEPAPDREMEFWLGPRIGLTKKRDYRNPEGKSFRDAPLRIRISTRPGGQAIADRKK